MDVDNNNFGVKVKEEVEDASYYGSNQNYEGIKVKEEIEDANYQEVKQESFENDLSNTFIKQECKLEVNLNCDEDEHLKYDENLEKWTSTNVIATKRCYEEQFFQCPECSVKTKYEANLKKHILFMHSKNELPGSRRVQNKNKNIQNIPALEIEFQIEYKLRNLQSTFPVINKNDLILQKKNSVDSKPTTHKHKFLTKKKFSYNCSDCSFQSNLKAGFIFHVYKCHYTNDHDDDSLEMPVCPYCKKHKPSYKLKHHLTYCSKVKYLQCDYCLSQLRGKYSLQQHIFTRHFEGGIFKKTKEYNLNYQPILKPCPRCGRRLKHSVHLSRHIATCGKKGIFHCSTCSFTTNYEEHFTEHILKHLKKNNLCLDLTYGKEK